MKIYREGSCAVIDTGVHVFTAEITAEDRTPFSGVLPYFSEQGSSFPLRIGDFNIIAFGSQNNLPSELRQVLDENNITPEILNKQTQLLWGQGPALYEIRYDNGKRIKYWVTDKNIESWLKSWAWEDYLLKATIEFRHINGHFTKYFRNRAPRVGGKGKIDRLEHVSSKNSRLEWPDKNNNINHIIVGDFVLPWQKGLKKYPVFDVNAPFKNPVSLRYSNLYSFALDNDYSRSSFYGSLNWIKLGSSIPKLLMNFNVNAAAIKHHIKSPAIYWDEKKVQLMKNCELQGTEYKDEMLENLKDDIFKKFTEGLVGIEKAGKILTSETIYDEMGQEYVGWEVITIDQKVKNYITAQTDIAKRAAFETTAGTGLHPALSNISADGNLPSGSEQLYAFKLYLSTGVDIPESIVCKDINNAIVVLLYQTYVR
jgi:hypothetical protein